MAKGRQPPSEQGIKVQKFYKPLSPHLTKVCRLDFCWDKNPKYAVNLFVQ